MRCPYCQTENRDDREKCYHCEKDVSMLRVIVNKARHHYNVALEHAERGRIHEAVNEMRNCIDLDHQFAPAHVVLGTLYAKRGEFDKARECWNTALALNPDMAKSRDYLQRAEELLASCTTAHEFFDAMSGRYPTRLNPTALWMGATALDVLFDFRR